MEERLNSEYKDLRKKGLKVKGWWFRLHARQVLDDLLVNVMAMNVALQSTCLMLCHVEQAI